MWPDTKKQNQAKPFLWQLFCQSRIAYDDYWFCTQDTINPKKEQNTEKKCSPNESGFLLLLLLLFPPALISLLKSCCINTKIKMKKKKISSLWNLMAAAATVKTTIFPRIWHKNSPSYDCRVCVCATTIAKRFAEGESKKLIKFLFLCFVRFFFVCFLSCCSFVSLGWRSQQQREAISRYFTQHLPFMLSLIYFYLWMRVCVCVCFVYYLLHFFFVSVNLWAWSQLTRFLRSCQLRLRNCQAN